MIDQEKLVEIYAQLKDINARIDKLVKEYEELEGAFPKDDENLPDFSGHRMFHKKETAKQKQNAEAANRVKSNLITWTIIGIISILGSIIVQVYIEPILKLAKQ